MCDKKFPVNVRDNNRRNKGGAINEHFCLLATILKRRIILFLYFPSRFFISAQCVL